MQPISEKFRSRKFWLALIGQITGLIVLFVPEHAGGIEAASANIGALLLMALTAWGYIKAEAEIDQTRTIYEDHRSTRPGTPETATGPDKAPAGDPISLNAALPLLLGLLLMAGGCEAHPLQVTLQARRSYTDVLTQIELHALAGHIDKDTAQAILEIKPKVELALDAMEAAALEGDQFTFHGSLERFRDYLEQLIRAQFEAERKVSDERSSTGGARPGDAADERSGGVEDCPAGEARVHRAGACVFA